MPTPFGAPITSFAGGVNLGVPPHKVRESEVPSAVNYFNVATGAKGRYGAKAFIGPLYGADRDPYPNQTEPIITGMHLWSRVGPPRESVLFVGTADSIGAWRAGSFAEEANPYTGTTDAVRIDPAWVELKRGGNGALGAARYPWSDEPWHFIQYNQIVYGFRRGVGMRRITPLPMLDLTPGIAAPSAVPTLTSGGVGTTTGAFYVSYAYRNSRTGAMSNRSPSSLIFNAAANTLVVGNLQISENPQVDSRRVFITLPNQTGAFYRWFDVPNNVEATSAAFNVDVTLLGELASDRNAPPPNGLLFGVIWQERLWASDGKYLYCSEVGQPEAMPAFNVLSVFPDDGQAITGLCADENRLYIGKENSVIYLTGTVSSLERHTLDGANGVVSHGSMKLVDGKLFWFTGTDFMASEGGNGRSLTAGEGGDGTRLALYMKYLNQEDARKTVAEVWPNDKLYIFLGRWNQSWAQDQQDGHPHSVRGSDMLAFNYDTGAWWPWRYRELPAHIGGTLQPAMALRTVIDSDGSEKLLAAYRTGVNQLLAPNYGYDDLVRAGFSAGAPPLRATYGITYTLGPKELYGAGASFISKAVEFEGLFQKRTLVQPALYVGGRYQSADLAKARQVELVDNLNPETNVRPITSLRIKLPTRSAVPRLFLNLVIDVDQPTLMTHSTAPPYITGITWDTSVVKRRRRTI